MSWWPVGTAIKLDHEFQELESSDAYDFDFRRLLGATSSDFSSHGGQTSARLMLTMLDTFGKGKLKQCKYFIDIGAGCGQPVFLFEQLKEKGVIDGNTRVIAIEKSEYRCRFLIHRANIDANDRLEIEQMDVASEMFSALVDSLVDDKGLIYWNNSVWGSETIAAVEETLLNKLKTGSCVISTKQLFLRRRSSTNGREVFEEVYAFEKADNELSWYGSKRDVEVYYYIFN